jgi:hypothetical protein
MSKSALGGGIRKPTSGCQPFVAELVAQSVRKLRPWGYWRFETKADRLFPNQVPDRPALQAIGPVGVAGAPGENLSAVFGPTRADQYLVMEAWTPPRSRGYAVELWALSEEFNASTLISLTSRADEPDQKHTLLLELTGRSHHLVHDPCRVRFLDRWPPGTTAGVNVFSRHRYIPYRWHHFVAQKILDRLELYLDGELEGTVQADPDEGTTSCRLLVGRLKTGRQPNVYQIRPFVGRLDELAVYDRPLSPGGHPAALRTGNGRPAHSALTQGWCGSGGPKGESQERALLALAFWSLLYAASRQPVCLRRRRARARPVRPEPSRLSSRLAGSGVVLVVPVPPPPDPPGVRMMPTPGPGCCCCG